MIRAQRYSAALHHAIWNAFIGNSRNGTFLFRREYMDYHADRFEDASVLFWHDQELCAVLPACRRGDTLSSHAGLTYGGLILAEQTGAARVIACLDALVEHARAEGYARFLSKLVPHIYCRAPAEEERYALFRLGARCCRNDASVALALPRAIPLQERRRRSARKAQKLGLNVGQSEDWAAYWSVLEQNLADRHDALPVHSLTEIHLLAQRCPEIRLFMTRDQAGAPQAGVVIYEANDVAHAQYIASTAEGRASGALDLLFSWLIDEHYAHRKRWFDFGISTEENGHYLNEGLIGFKEGFGARTVCYEHFELDLAAPAQHPEHTGD